MELILSEAKIGQEIWQNKAGKGELLYDCLGQRGKKEKNLSWTKFFLPGFRPFVIQARVFPLKGRYSLGNILNLSKQAKFRLY